MNGNVCNSIKRRKEEKKNFLKLTAPAIHKFANEDIIRASSERDG